MNIALRMGAFILTACLILSGAVLPAFAEEEKEEDNLLYLMGNADYDKAYDVLSRINSERSKRGVSTLSMDQTLMEAAMTRAAECAIYFEHARPNGSKWSSVNARVKGENLGKGTGSAARIMSLWMKSSGHRENVLRSSFHSVGVACFEYGGITYWVQLFGTSGSEGAEQPENGPVSVGIDLPEDGAFSFDYEITRGIDGPAVSSASGEDDEDDEEVARPVRMFEGDSMALGLTGDYLVFDPARVDWESSNPDAATIDENGKLMVTGSGDAVITAKSGNIERAAFTLDARQHIKDALVMDSFAGTAEITKRSYNDTPVCPEIRVIGDEGPLLEGRDYTVMYRKNEAAGDAEIEIRGIGDFGGIVTRTFTIV